MIDVHKELLDNSDKKLNEFNKKIIPGIENSLGVKTPVMRRIARDILRDDWRAFLEQPPVYYEDKILRALVIAKAPMDTEERIAMTEAFLLEIDNWAVCDILCGSWKIEKGKEQILWNFCLDLIEKNTEFEMRVGAVMFLNHFIDDDHIDEVLRILSKTTNDGYYYKMGSAWALSFCYIKYPEKTEPILVNRLPDEKTARMAVQKVCDSFRVPEESKIRLRTLCKKK